jgi:carbon dioxide concentrating mechanism protein CcmL
MNFGKVLGTVVSTQKNDGIQGKRYLLVQSCQPNGDLLNEFHIAIDLVGSGHDEMVLLSQGSSSIKPIDSIYDWLSLIIY